MIAVVTGSSGFIGSHVVDALLARGATVRVLRRPESPASHDPRVAQWTADLLDDRSVRESPIWKDVTHVFHAGGVTKRRTLAEFRYGNVVPTANILSALVARGRRVPRFVYLSSQAAAGPAASPDRPVQETDPPHPIEAYGQSKLEAEEAVSRYAGQLSVTILRPGAVYGPRDVDFLKAFKEARRRIAFHAAPRDQALSVVYVRDLVHAVLLAGDHPAASGRTYFVAAGDVVTWNHIYRGVAKLAGTVPLEIQLPRAAMWVAGRAGNLLSLVSGRHFLLNANKIALSRPRWWLCDATRAKRELGWSATTTLADGLEETYRWYLDAGWLRAKSPAAATKSGTLEKHS